MVDMFQNWQTFFFSFFSLFVSPLEINVNSDRILLKWQILLQLGDYIESTNNKIANRVKCPQLPAKWFQGISDMYMRNISTCSRTHFLIICWHSIKTLDSLWLSYMAGELLPMLLFTTIKTKKKKKSPIHWTFHTSGSCANFTTFINWKKTRKLTFFLQVHLAMLDTVVVAVCVTSLILMLMLCGKRQIKSSSIL